MKKQFGFLTPNTGICTVLLVEDGSQFIIPQH
jgi:hypothetical protein